MAEKPEIVHEILKGSVMRQELHATKDYLRAVLNHVHDAIHIHDMDGKIVDVNDKMLEMYRVTREEAMDSYIIRDYSAPCNPVGRLPAIWKKVLSGENEFFEWKAKRPKDGSEFDVEVYLTRLSLPDGDFILANVRDITERKRVEQELHATKDYLRTVFNNVYDAIFIHDRNGKVIDVNDKLLELYRVTREEAIKLYIIPDYSTSDYTEDQALANWALSNWKKVMAGEHQFFEWKARRPKDGSEFDVEVFLTKLSLPQGDYILANVRDISERKRMERLLIRERETFFSVMNNNPHGIALFDTESRFVYFNPEFSNITGYGLDDVPTGRDWAEKAYPDPEYRAKVVAFWKEDRLPEGRGRDVEWRIAGKNGQYKDVEFRVTYLGDKSLVVLTDTTARKRAEEELRAEKQKFQTMTESLPVGIVMMGSDDKIKYINPKFKQLFGYDIADIPNVEDWFLRAYPDPTYRNKALHNWWNNLRSWKPGEGAPYTRKVTCRDNTHKYVNFIPVQLQTNEILLTCEDITESKEAGDKLRERNLELEVLNNIIASVSSSLHLPEILETLKRVFVEKLGIPVGGVFFYNESGNALTMEMSWGVPDRLVSDFETFVLRQYTGETAIHHIPSSRSDDSLFSKFLHRGSSNLRIPLLAKGEIQGMIYLMREAPSFHEDQIAFFKTLGQQVGVIVQNARLFSQVRQSHTQMKALSLQLVEVQEAERRYIARELHDQIGQELTGLKFALEMNVLQSEGKTKAGLMEAQSIVNKLVVLVRELSLKLRPSMLDDLGLLPTLLWHFERFTNQTAIQVTFKHSGCNDERFPREVETTIYRIAQEGLTNVARHAKTDQVIVRLWSDGKTLGIQIEDSGIGFNDAVLNAGLTGGLYGMRERAMLLGGRLTIETRPSAGTRLTAELPINRDDE